MKKIIIIGAGVSGLSAGIYARRNGFDCEIYEKNHNAGGECVTWKRKGYTIDNCVHWMTGTSPKKEIYRTWEEVGVLGADKEVIQNESFLRIEYAGQKLDLWHDVERLRADMLAISPEDKPAIEEFIRYVYLYQTVEFPADMPFSDYSLKRKFKSIMQMKAVGAVHAKLQTVSLQQYASKFKHPLLQRAVTAYIPRNYNVSSWFYILGTFTGGNGALPRGGSAAISGRMLETYLNEGGKIFYNKEAVGMSEEKKTVKSIKFADGTEAGGDFVVFACDVSVVFNKILGHSHIDDYFRHRFFYQIKHPIYTSMNIYLGVDKEQAAFLPDTSWYEGSGFEVCGKVINQFILKSYASEPSFAPEGKTLLQALIVQYGSDFKSWRSMYENSRETYKAAKQRIAESVVKSLREHYPQLSGDIDIIETVTPMSFYRWCGAYRGAYMSFVLTPFVARNVSHKGNIKGLKNAFLAGQWLQSPGGLPNALVTGKFAIFRIMKRLGLRFTAV